jgi:hypothetical protein
VMSRCRQRGRGQGKRSVLSDAYRVADARSPLREAVVARQVRGVPSCPPWRWSATRWWASAAAPVQWADQLRLDGGIGSPAPRRTSRRAQSFSLRDRIVGRAQGNTDSLRGSAPDDLPQRSLSHGNGDPAHSAIAGTSHPTGKMAQHDDLLPMRRSAQQKRVWSSCTVSTCPRQSVDTRKPGRNSSQALSTADMQENAAFQSLTPHPYANHPDGPHCDHPCPPHGGGLPFSQS